MKDRENNELCPKCKSNDIIFHGNWTGVMVSDIYAEHFWMCKCNSCGFTFVPSSNDNKPNPVDDKRNHA
jgi:predicted nucleic-acid-binding Zn-ribbon protein